MGNENISNFQRKIPIPVPKVRTAIRSACRKLRFKIPELSVAFVGERRMRRLNKEYLGHDYVTDVLTFNYGDTIPNSCELSIMSPEIVICPAVAARNARRYGNTCEREIVLCVVHGILHLCGYDDHSPKDVQRMRRKETEILGKVL